VNLQQLIAAMEERVNRLREIREMETRTEEVRAEAVRLTEEATDLNAQIAEARAAESVISSFEDARRTSRGRASENDSVAGRREETRTQSPGEVLTGSESYRAWVQQGHRGAFEFRFDEGSEETRAITNTALFPAAYLEAQRLPGIQRDSDLFGSLRDVLLTGTLSAESLVFFKENVFTNAAAFVEEATATGGASGIKPEASITFEQDTATVGTIAHWIPITEQFEWAAPELRSYIDGRLLDGLQLVEDTQLLLGDGNAPNPEGLLEHDDIQVLDAAYFAGATTQNVGTDAEPFDRIARARRLIATVGRARASFIVLNPEDDERFQTVADANGHYYGGGPFQTGQPSTFWGLPRVVNENMPAGQALVGDGRAAQIWDRMSARIVVGHINDQLIRNMKTVLAEKRVGLAVYRPAAFALVDLYA
jgi:HK97 family phage major capsid protein